MITGQSPALPRQPLSSNRQYRLSPLVDPQTPAFECSVLLVSAVGDPPVVLCVRLIMRLHDFESVPLPPLSTVLTRLSAQRLLFVDGWAWVGQMRGMRLRRDGGLKEGAGGCRRLGQSGCEVNARGCKPIGGSTRADRTVLRGLAVIRRRRRLPSHVFKRKPQVHLIEKG